MQRYNIFSHVHKGLRAMLYQTANSLQQTNFIDSHEADETMKQVMEVMDLFDKHAFTEDHFILTAIEKYEADVASEFEEEHVEDHELSKRIRTLVNMFIHTLSAEERSIIGSAIRYAFVDFLIFNLKHMAKEEVVLNNLLWSFYSDEQLHDITKQILAYQAPEDMAKYSRWMMNGLSNNEIINWLKDVQNNAPDFVFQKLFTMASDELSGQRWEMVKASLVDEAMVA